MTIKITFNTGKVKIHGFTRLKVELAKICLLHCILAL